MGREGEKEKMSVHEIELTSIPDALMRIPGFCIIVPCRFDYSLCHPLAHKHTHAFQNIGVYGNPCHAFHFQVHAHHLIQLQILQIFFVIFSRFSEMQ